VTVAIRFRCASVAAVATSQATSLCTTGKSLHALLVVVLVVLLVVACILMFSAASAMAALLLLYSSVHGSKQQYNNSAYCVHVSANAACIDVLDAVEQ
jgi:tryptophan-rich sensory protein